MQLAEKGSLNKTRKGYMMKSPEVLIKYLSRPTLLTRTIFAIILAVGVGPGLSDCLQILRTWVPFQATTHNFC